MKSRSHLSLAVRPEIHGDSDQVVNGGIGALVEQDGHEHAQGVERKPRADTSVEAGVRDYDRQRVFPRQSQETEQDVEYLQDRKGLHCAIKSSVVCRSVTVPQTRAHTPQGYVLCPDVPEDLGPEDAMYAGRDLVSGGGEDDQTRQMVLDEFPHIYDSTMW